MIKPECATPRLATIHDVPKIRELLTLQSDQGNLLPRTESEIFRALREFYVIEDGGQVVACGALEIFTAQLGEVRSLAVASGHEGKGCGSAIVGAIETEARAVGLSKMMALTYVPDFFIKLGYRVVPMDQLPEKVWGVCIKCYKFQKCDEIAVLKMLTQDNSV